MLDSDQNQDLSTLYRLSIMVPEGLSTLRKALKASVLARGTEINTTYAEDEAQRIEGIQIDD